MISPEEERRLFHEADDEGALKDGDHVFLLSFEWYWKWKSYTAGQGPRPSAIDNTPFLLFDPEERVRPGAAINIDYLPVTQDQWTHLHNIYGGGPMVMRKAVLSRVSGEVRTYVTKIMVEVRSSVSEAPVQILMFPYQTIEELARRCLQKGLLKGQVSDQGGPLPPSLSLTVMNNPGGLRLGKDDFGKSLEECRVEDGDSFVLRVESKSSAWDDNNAGVVRSQTTQLLEPGEGPGGDDDTDSEPVMLLKPVPQSQPRPIYPVRVHDADDDDADNENGTPGNELAASSSLSSAAAATTTTTATAATLSSWDSRGPGFQLGRAAVPAVDPAVLRRSRGMCGLHNLGNTCFMNSALQCLSNVPGLTRYFTSDAYLGDVNETNPVGCKGRVAREYGELIKRMWAGVHNSVDPREFKYTIAKFAPRFTGYQQQDSQELLAFLLDGLHEDLNRVIVRRTTEAVESNGRPDAEVAALSWAMHKVRNDSVIVDHFQGQYRSIVSCPDCDRVSVTFDPFMYVTVELPVKNTQALTVLFTPLDKTVNPTVVSVDVSPQSGTVLDIKEGVADLVGVKSTNMILIEAEVHKTTREVKKLKYLKDSDELDLVLVASYQIDLEKELWASEVPAGLGHESKLVGASYYDKAAFVPVALSLRVEEARDAGPREPYQTFASGGSYNTSSSYNNSSYAPVPKLLQISKPVITVVSTNTTHHQLHLIVADLMGLSLEHENLASVSPSVSVKTEEAAAPNNNNNNNNNEESWALGGGPNPFEEERPAVSVSVEPRALPFRLGIISRSDFFDSPSSFEVKALQYEDTRSVIGPIDTYRGIMSVTVVVSRDHRLVDALSQYFHADHLVRHPSFTASLQARAEAEEDRHRGPKVFTLQQCLEKFTTKEKLSKDNLWYCNVCKEHKQATKKFDIWRAPDVLIIHLKRFSYGKYSRDKIENLVTFPVEGLDMGPFILSHAHNKDKETGQEGAPIYDLVSVSNHFGGMGGGHYTAYAKNPVNGWQCFDDSYVSAVREPESTIVSPSAYVLIYCRRGSQVSEAEA